MTFTLTPHATEFERVTDQLVAYSHDLNHLDPDGNAEDRFYTASEASHFLEELTRGSLWDFQDACRELTMYLPSGVVLHFVQSADATWTVTATLGSLRRTFTGRTAFDLADRVAGLGIDDA